MKYIITESSFVNLLVSFLDGMDHPKGVCHVEAKLNKNGNLVLIVVLKKEAFNVLGVRGDLWNTQKFREYYTNKVSDYIGITPLIFFEIGQC